MKTRNSKSPMVDAALLAQCHHLLGNRSNCLSFGKRRRHPLVSNQTTYHIGQHRITMCPLTTELGVSF